MDKEQIMIDGVDVSGCEGIDLSLHPLAKCKFLKFKTSDGGIAGIWCFDHTKCNFKQLARKTQECERLKDKLAVTQFNLEQKCKVLKDVGVVQDKNGGYQVMGIARYRKALEKIEEVINNILNSCLGRNTVSCRPAHNVCGDLIKILDIINKAKGERRNNGNYS